MLSFKVLLLELFAKTLSMEIEEWCQDGMGEKADTCGLSFVLCNLYFTSTLV